MYNELSIKYKKQQQQIGTKIYFVTKLNRHENYFVTKFSFSNVLKILP